jgi:hypothetical protein
MAAAWYINHNGSIALTEFCHGHLFGPGLGLFSDL